MRQEAMGRKERGTAQALSQNLSLGRLKRRLLLWQHLSFSIQRSPKRNKFNQKLIICHHLLTQSFPMPSQWQTSRTKVVIHTSCALYSMSSGSHMIVLSEKKYFFNSCEIVIETVKWTPISLIHKQIIQIGFVNWFNWFFQNICYLMEQWVNNFIFWLKYPFKYSFTDPY